MHNFGRVVCNLIFFLEVCGSEFLSLWWPLWLCVADRVAIWRHCVVTERHVYNMHMHTHIAIYHICICVMLSNNICTTIAKSTWRRHIILIHSALGLEENELGFSCVHKCGWFGCCRRRLRHPCGSGELAVQTKWPLVRLNSVFFSLAFYLNIISFQHNAHNSQCLVAAYIFFCE